MSDPKRRYIDELTKGIEVVESGSAPFNGGMVLISLETAKRLKALYEMSDRLTIYVDRENTIDIAGVLNALDEEMPEPPSRNIDAEVDAMPLWQRVLIPTLRPDYVVPSLDDEMPEPKP